MSPEQEKTKSGTVSSGVEALLRRLRDEGVGSGRAEAEKIVAEAERRAKWLVSQAQEEANLIREKARKESDQFKTAGEEALRVAARDALLSLRSELTQRFSHEVRRLVTQEVAKEDFLQQLIREVLGEAREAMADAQNVEVLLPRDVVGLEELRRRPEELGNDQLSQFVKAITGDVLQGEGITFGVADDNRAGLRLRFTDQELTLDYSDEAIAALLLRHLQPRFRALLEGIVK